MKSKRKDIEIIEKSIEENFGTWTLFESIVNTKGEVMNNAKRLLYSRIAKVNEWLDLLGLEITITIKRKQ